MKSHSVGYRAAAAFAMLTVQLCVAALPGSAARKLASAGLIAKQQSMSRPCVTYSQKSAAGLFDGEYLPSYSTRSVPQVDSNGRKYVGFHCWRETDASAHSLSWESDAVNAMNDFMICRYSFGDSAAREVYLELRGGQIDFINKDGSGSGDALLLAVYEGTPPSALFKGKVLTPSSFSKAVYGPRRWTKSEKTNSVTIEGIHAPIKIRSGVKDFSVVLVGVDSWIDTRVTIKIDGLRILARPAPAKKPARKK